MAEKMIYSEKYYDDNYEYRHVILTEEQAMQLPRSRLLTEAEWRAIGVQQAPGWTHYMIHKPEPHILLFRRPLVKESEKQFPNVAFPCIPQPSLCPNEQA